MFKKLTLAAAAGAGYVLGAKAGKERYRQIESAFRQIAGMPAVQSATATVKQTAADVADTAKTTASETASVVVEKAKEVRESAKGDRDVVVDLQTASPGATTLDPRPVIAKPGGPMAGAAASGSAPDVTRP